MANHKQKHRLRPTEEQGRECSHLYRPLQLSILSQVLVDIEALLLKILTHNQPTQKARRIQNNYARIEQYRSDKEG